jgi:hypothetical protein
VFVGLHKHLKLLVQVAVLLLEHVNVYLERGNFTSETVVSVGNAGIAELDIIVLLSHEANLVLSGSDLGLQVEKDAVEVLSALHLSLALSHKDQSLLVASIEGPLLSAVVAGDATGLVLEHGELALGGLEHLDGAAELEVPLLGDLGQVVGSIVGLGQLVVCAADLLAGAVVLALSIGVELAESLDLILVLGLLLLELAHLEEESVYVLAHAIALVRLVGDVPLQATDVDLLSRDLVTGRAEVLGHVRDDATLFVEEVPEVVHFLLEAYDANLVGVVLQAEVVVLQQLYITFKHLEVHKTGDQYGWSMAVSETLLTFSS